MSRDIAVRVEEVGKMFRIGVREKTNDSLAKLLFELVRSPVSNYRKYRSLYRFEDAVDADGNTPADIVWALRDVSFEVKQGEVLGILGRNGAGKSTLLKILTRITPPTHGRIEIRGRVSSLLEVGTGFHRELTGRENVYLNGTILGMKKKEVDRKFDEIVEFSGVERFLDTPVKRYSSGMAVRLAFSVAAHLEPEILIIDEVLAVGDAAFQKKCINKMHDVGRSGRTVLFVSHNMPAVSMLCDRALLLDGGRKVKEGTPHDIINFYLSSGECTPSIREWTDPATAPGADVARVHSVRVTTADGRTASSIDIRDEVGIEMTFDVIKPGFVLLPHFYFYNEEGTVVFASLNQDPMWQRRPYPVGRYKTTAWIPGNFLSDGFLLVSCALITRSPDVTQFYLKQTIAFNVIDNMGPGTARGDYAGNVMGVVRPVLRWSTHYQPEQGETEPALATAWQSL
jgi:lipopolysaccharide transport system ATP-binding protein